MPDQVSPTPPTPVAKRRWFGQGRQTGRRLKFFHQLLLQAFCLVVAVSVLFPIMWIASMSFEGADYQRPTQLSLLPSSEGAPNLDAYRAVIESPTAQSSPVSFWRLLSNSVALAAGVSFFSVMIGVTAAYAFSRFNFVGRKIMFLGIGFILLMPAVATLAPLFTMLTKIRVSWAALKIMYFILGGGLVIASLGVILRRLMQSDLDLNTAVLLGIVGVIGGLLVFAGVGVNTDAKGEFVLRPTLYGVGFAMISGALPFAIWNLKGYLDTIPKELEEAAIIDGATPNQVFFRIVLPLSTPALAVTAFLGFMAGWTEFALSAQFLNDQENYTLALALRTLTGQFSTVPWSKFAAMSMIISIPVSIVYLLLQKYIVGGLTLGGVKG